MWYEPVAQWKIFGFCGCWFDLQWWSHGMHCCWDPMRSKQLFSVPYVPCRCLKDFLVMIIQIYIYIYIYILWRVSTRIFNFSRYGLRKKREGFKVKEVNVIWMDTWGFLNQTNNITGSCFFFLFFIYVSFIYFFIQKKSQLWQRTNKEQNECNKKNIQKCGGHFAPNSVWLGPTNKTKYFFSSFTEEQESLLFVFMDVQILTKSVFRRN